MAPPTPQERVRNMTEEQLREFALQQLLRRDADPAPTAKLEAPGEAESKRGVKREASSMDAAPVAAAAAPPFRHKERRLASGTTEIDLTEDD